IKGDLFLMATAWNGGPGNLNKWRRATDDMNDPLFFIESIPSRETRIFVERVLTNLWIYRDQLGQPSPSLDAIASGQWPVYKALDDETLLVADNVKDRKSPGISTR
ncbi:MAG: lytic transglycosylase domain-containing protein, partial [Alphaproteobacteria bacterium]